MFKKNKKTGANVQGFTLTEVMIAMMILTVAIVSASNLLVDMISSNRNNLTTLQAYYLAQEGLEAVHNIRDTNWLHNKEWLGADSVALWGSSFEIPQSLSDGTQDCTSQGRENCYGVDLQANGLALSSVSAKLNDIAAISYLKPWTIAKENGSEIYKNTDIDKVYLGPSDNSPTSKDTGFKRTIIIKKYDCSNLGPMLCPQALNNYVLVQAKVEWSIGANARNLLLSEVLSNWKGGAI